MLLAAITGSFRSGKTFLLNHLSSLGFKIFSSDAYVSELYLDPEIQKQILELLPDLKIFDKLEIAKLIFSNVGILRDGV